MLYALPGAFPAYSRSMAAQERSASRRTTSKFSAISGTAMIPFLFLANSVRSEPKQGRNDAADRIAGRRQQPAPVAARQPCIRRVSRSFFSE